MRKMSWENSQRVQLGIELIFKIYSPLFLHLAYVSVYWSMQDLSTYADGCDRNSGRHLWSVNSKCGQRIFRASKANPAKKRANESWSEDSGAAVTTNYRRDSKFQRINLDTDVFITALVE